MFDIDGVILWLQQNPEWILTGLFLSAFVESFAIIGIFIPGVVLLFGISSLAATADIHPSFVLIIVYSSSCIADITSYLIGIKLDKKIYSLWPFKTNPNWLKKGQDFFRSYGMLGVFVGRFLGPIRPVMPLTAGTMGMKFKYFLSIDLFSGLIWAPVYSLPGYYGTKLLLQTSYTLELMAGLLLVSILAIVLFKNFNIKSKN